MKYIEEQHNNDVSILELERALKYNEFLLHYQPQVNGIGEIVGFEVLIRWNRPLHGLVFPNDFIEVSERTGFIIKLGKWILKTACYQVKQWQQAFLKPLHISVNVAFQQLIDNSFVSFVKKTLKETGLNPNSLTLEITERLTDDLQLIINPLEQLKNLGVKIALDDFGTGYNSLYYLKELPVDQIKIDRSFVQDTFNEKDKVILKSMIGVAKALKMEIVAEGIETKKQKDTFSSYCDLLQGFYFGKPLPVHKIEESMKITG